MEPPAQSTKGPSSPTPSFDHRQGSQSAGGGADRRRARLHLLVVLISLIVVMLLIATWLTFFHATSTFSSMHMEGTTMGPSVCNVLPSGVVDQALGQRSAAPRSTSTRQTTTCRYQLGGTRTGLVVTYAMNESASSFAHSVSSLRTLGTVTSIRALGHEAFAVRRASDGRTIVLVRHDGNVVRIETTAPVAAATRLASIATPQL